MHNAKNHPATFRRLLTCRPAEAPPAPHASPADATHDFLVLTLRPDLSPGFIDTAPHTATAPLPRPR